MEVFIIIIFVIITIIVSKIGKKKNGKVNGKIIKYVEENGEHYPVFSFMTTDGKLIEERNTTYMQELSVEEAYSQKAKEFLSKQLPIENIPIVYKKKNPKDFIPQWID